MALADSVPGVSGGTIAFLMGFYDEFIRSLDNLIKGNKEERIKAILFLLKLGAGWLIGMALAVTVLAAVFEDGIYEASSLFLGFILFAIPVMIYEERESLKKPVNMLFIIPGIALVVLISVLGTNTADTSHMTAGLALYCIFAGMCGISAMVLPGISGSTILLTFGLYMPVIDSLKLLMHADFSGFFLLLFVGIGIIAGIFASVRTIKKSMDHFREQTIYVVIGMMIGSLYAIVQGPATLKIPKDPMTVHTFDIIFFAIGAAVVAGMQAAKMAVQKKVSAEKSVI